MATQIEEGKQPRLADPLQLSHDTRDVHVHQQ
jgi:hypothetical protein